MEGRAEGRRGDVQRFVRDERLEDVAFAVIGVDLAAHGGTEQYLVRIRRESFAVHAAAHEIGAARAHGDLVRGCVDGMPAVGRKVKLYAAVPAVRPAPAPIDLRVVRVEGDVDARVAEDGGKAHIDGVRRGGVLRFEEGRILPEFVVEGAVYADALAVIIEIGIVACGRVGERVIAEFIHARRGAPCRREQQEHRKKGRQ